MEFIEFIINPFIDGIIFLGLVSIIMLPVIGLIWIMEKLDDKYHWNDKLFNNDEYENE